jgi:hypothetical protein
LEESCTADNVCGGIKSEVKVVDSEIETVTACVDFSAPLDLAETCTQVQVCEDDSSKICGCTAIYDGAACRSCEVCEGGNGLKLDCTNIRDEVIIGECQAVTAATSFEFIPNFNITIAALTGDDADDTSGGANASEGDNTSGSVVVRGVPLVGIVAACLGFLFL